MCYFSFKVQSPLVYFLHLQFSKKSNSISFILSRSLCKKKSCVCLPTEKNNTTDAFGRYFSQYFYKILHNVSYSTIVSKVFLNVFSFQINAKTLFSIFLLCNLHSKQSFLNISGENIKGKTPE